MISTSSLPQRAAMRAREQAQEHGRWLAPLTRTDGGSAAALLRVALGAVMFPHGAQKALGWFGGPGLGATLRFFGGVLHVPTPLALAVVAAEFLGSLALLLGLFTRVAAAGIGAVMLGAIGMVHAPNGFFMNWFGTQSGEGYEYHLLALGMVASLLVLGGGRGSLDGLLTRS
jgi:putative oxidoreductase